MQYCYSLMYLLYIYPQSIFMYLDILHKGIIAANGYTVAMYCPIKLWFTNSLIIRMFTAKFKPNPNALQVGIPVIKTKMYPKVNPIRPTTKRLANASVSLAPIA